MKAQPKSPCAQLNLPLLQLVEALIELLLSAAAPHAAEGGSHEPQADR